VVFVHRQPEVTQIADHDVGNGAFLPWRARERCQLGEKVDDLVGHLSILGLGGGRADGGPLARACECGTDEVAEARRRTGRPRLELRMELAPPTPGEGWAPP